MRFLISLLIVAGGCVPKLSESGPTLPRCDWLRQLRDAYSFGAAGASTLAGVGGFSALQFTRENSQRHVAELSLAVGVTGAILAAMASATGNAYADEGCPQKFAKFREAKPGS